MQRVIYTLVLLASFFPLHVSGGEIKIVGSLGLTGKYRDIADMQYKGFMLWEEEVNKKGGLLGKKVKVLIHDDRSDPETAKRLYESIIVEEKADLLFAPYSSEITEAVAPVVERYGYPVITSGASSDRLWQKGYKNIFGLYSPASSYATGFLELLVLKGLKTIAILYADDAFSVEIASGTKRWAERLGLELSLYEGFKKGEIPSHIITKLMELKPDAVIVCGHLEESINVLRSIKKKGWFPSAYFASVGPALKRFYEVMGRDAEGVFSASQWEPNNGIKGSREFYSAFIRKYRIEPSYHAASAYASGLLIEEAVRRAGSLDRDKIRNILSMMDTITPLGRFRVNKSGLQIKHMNLIIQWQKGKKEIVWPEELATSKPVWR
jgi:branched-chain amino acid transport system substrate-binding protein